MIRHSISTLGLDIRVLVLALALPIFVASGVARADHHEQDVDPNIKYRQSVMSIIGTNMGAIGDIMKNRLSMPGAIANHAGQMAESAGLIAPAFKKSISDGPTDAKEEIWQDWAKFEKALAKFEESARAMQTAAASGDPEQVGPAMKALGKSCGGCHKPFRKPKEESFRNM